MKKINIIIYLCVIFFIVGKANSTESIEFNRQEAVQSTIQYLSSPELEGRYPGTDGIEKAAEHITSKFKEYGIKPLGDTYRQQFDVQVMLEPGENNLVSFQTIIPRPGVPKEEFRKVSRSWETMNDWIPLNFSENGSVQTEIVFAGYGITAEELNYNDYKEVDVSGKVVVVYSDSPDGEDFDGKGKFYNYSSYRYKATNARDHGAVGIIFIRISGDSMNIFHRYDYSTLGKNSGLIAIQANRHSLDRFFPRYDKLLELEKRINKDLKPYSFELEDITVNIAVELKPVMKETSNIIGIVEGSDPKLKNEYYIVGAHYDHLGWGGPTSRYSGQKQRIHPGADDNASGVAGMLELARLIKENPLKRSVIFIAFSAEETGLHGSRHYVNHPLHELEQSKIMLNFDMIGRLRNDQLSIFGSGSAVNLDNLLNTMAAEHSITLTTSLGAHGPSDHASFYRAKIPAIHIFSGIHNDYHTPDDTWQKLNPRGILKIVDYAYSFLTYSDMNDIKFEYVENIEGEEKKEQSGHSYANVWFGIVPDFEESPLGCKIAGSSPGSPAFKAGLVENDIITHINDIEIKNLQDFMYAIRKYKAGDTVDVKILRGEPKKEILLKVTLVSR